MKDPETPKTDTGAKWKRVPITVVFHLVQEVLVDSDDDQVRFVVEENHCLDNHVATLARRKDAAHVDITRGPPGTVCVHVHQHLSAFVIDSVHDVLNQTLPAFVRVELTCGTQPPNQAARDRLVMAAPWRGIGGV